MPGRTRSKAHSHELPASALWGISSKRRLSEVLHWKGSPSTLASFSRRPENYSRYLDKTKPEKPRLVEAPQEGLKRLQARLHGLLVRIKIPDYIHSAAPGRSYLSNSLAHRDADGCTVTMDISEFFPSVSRDRVVRLFIKHFCCARDVADVLANLVCCDGHLATGSPASPILSYWANKELFDRIDARVNGRGGVFTLYMDDIAVTGRGIGDGDIKWVTKLLMKVGLRINKSKTKVFRAGRGKLITGRVLVNGESRAPHKQHLRMKAAITASEAAPDNSHLRASAVGRVRHVALLDDARRDHMRVRARGLASSKVRRPSPHSG